MKARIDVILLLVIVFIIGIAFIGNNISGRQLWNIEPEIGTARWTCTDNQDLIGFYWNWDLYKEEVRLINTCTGRSSLIGFLDDFVLYPWSAYAINREANEIYINGRIGREDPDSIYTIDVRTANSTHVLLEPSSTIYYNIRDDLTLIGFQWNFEFDEEELVSIDPSTGAVDHLGFIEDLDFIILQMYPIDTEQNILYLLGRNFPEEPEYLYKINALNGSATRAVTDKQYVVFHVRFDSALVGLTWNWDRWKEELRLINPDTGQSTYIGDIAQMELITPMVTTYDKKKDLIYQNGKIRGDWDTDRIFIINATSSESRYITVDRKFDILFVL
ncbi:MAG: hypothetical protein AABX08_03540 [Nanoarchaeota archaeon]